MAHNLNENRMFYYGSKPWHGLGVELDHPATAREAIEAARLDYVVKKTQRELIGRDDDNGKQFPVFDHFATYRTDTYQSLGCVGQSYKVIQNTECFDFFDSVIGEGKAVYHTAGALGKGERIWVLAKLPNTMIIGKEDEVEKYLLLTNSHDGKSSLLMYFTPVRVVCQNTLNVSMKNAKEGIRIRHSGNIKVKVEEAQRVLGIATMFYSDFEKISNKFAETKLGKDQVETYFTDLLFNEEQKKNPEEHTRLVNQRNELLGLFEHGAGNEIKDVRHSLWTAYNAVTEYADHKKVVKREQSDPSLRLNSIWFGSAALFKKKAYSLALDLAGIGRG